MCIVIGLIVWLVVAYGFLAICRMSAKADRMNEEMKAYNERVGFRWH